MAQAIFEQMVRKESSLKDKLEVDCAGIAVINGKNATAQAISIMQKRGINISSHKAKQITPELLLEADLIITMCGSNLDAVVKMVPRVIEKAFTLKQFALGLDSDGGTSCADLDVVDPVGKDLGFYQKCAEEIEENLRKLLRRLEQNY
jgi:protein-tyrosine-phosphatase